MNAYVEPMVHNGRELLGEAGHFHSFSMDDEPLEMKEILKKYFAVTYLGEGDPAGGRLSERRSSTRTKASGPHGWKSTLVIFGFLKVNYDTGTAFFDGENPYRGLETALPLLVNVHAKDLSVHQADTGQGKLTGTPVGCACGDGVIDWSRVVAVLEAGRFQRRALGGMRHAQTGHRQLEPLEWGSGGAGKDSERLKSGGDLCR